jgi:hypothetical protein
MTVDDMDAGNREPRATAIAAITRSRPATRSFRIRRTR